MKEIYLKPEIEVKDFKTIDIVTTSGEATDDNTVVWPFS
jgi:hypothetical protein